MYAVLLNPTQSGFINYIYFYVDNNEALFTEKKITLHLYLNLA